MYIIVLLLLAVSYRPIELDVNYQHDRWNTQPKDIMRHFRAYDVSFDSDDDNIITGCPEWVAYEIKPLKEELPKSPARPYKWIHEKGVSPPDESYAGSGFDRGHLCMKNHAWRLGENADWNTHTTINACPQYPEFNRGIWLDLENQCSKWADEYQESIWIITGPCYYNFGGVEWIGDDAMKVAVPQAFFKIIIRAKNGTPHVIALLYPHHADYEQKGPYYHRQYLVSVDYIEVLTNLDFFTSLPDELEMLIESRRATRLWGEEVYMQRKK